MAVYALSLLLILPCFADNMWPLVRTLPVDLFTDLLVSDILETELLRFFLSQSLYEPVLLI